MIATIYPVAASEEGEHTVVVTDMSESGVQEAVDIEVMVLQVMVDHLHLQATHLPTSLISILQVVIQTKEVLVL